MEQYPYKELTYKIIGLIYETYNSLGFGYQEKYYQRAFVQLLTVNGFDFKKELKVPINFKGKVIGRYFIDFVIENIVAIEFKVADKFYREHLQQLLAYLKSAKIKVGLLVLFSKNGIKIKRLIN